MKSLTGNRTLPPGPPVTPHFLRLLRTAGRPLALQVSPDEKEKNRTGLTDPLAEERYSPVPGLVHRYPDRALILTTAKCLSYCRFCTRKRNWGKSFDIRKHWNDILSYLGRTESIREVILSGGDPLTLPPPLLLSLLRDLRRLPGIGIIRLASRALTYQPSLITPALVRNLSRFFPLYFMTHFNHPAELSPEACAKARLLNRNSVILLNQTVLLKNVNDSEPVLSDLSFRLLACGIKPYALHLLDEVQGISHFRTPAGKGKRIIRQMRRSRTGIGIPLLILDRKNGRGKQIIAP